eukprot:4483009-Pyramimonas_sp.AAC.1
MKSSLAYSRLKALPCHRAPMSTRRNPRPEATAGYRQLKRRSSVRRHMAASTTTEARRRFHCPRRPRR